MKRSDKTRQKIMTATIEVMRGSQSLQDLTIRSIAKHAQVGVGLINYHFQTKENLINLSVRSFIGELIDTWPDQIPGKSTSALETLTAMLMASSDFLANFPRISKISIHNDQLNPSADDNTQQTILGILPVLRFIFGERIDDDEIYFIAGQIVATIQAAFIRSTVNRSFQGFDFFKKNERDLFIEELIDRLCISPQAAKTSRKSQERNNGV